MKIINILGRRAIVLFTQGIQPQTFRYIKQAFLSENSFIFIDSMITSLKNIDIYNLFKLFRMLR